MVTFCPSRITVRALIDEHGEDDVPSLQGSYDL
jgi:hypothetical protein